MKALALTILCAAMFLDALDTSAVGVALPSIQHDLHLSNTSLQWLVSGYTVAYGGFLLVGGRIADLLGRRRTFLIAMGLFAVASLGGGLLSAGPLLVTSRVVKGIAAAFTAPAALSIITTTYKEGPERNRAIAIYATTAASGYSLGLVMSGALSEVSWRLVFFLPAALGLLVFLVTPLVIRADQPTSERRSYDFGGTLAATAGALLLVYTFVQIPNAGFASVRTLASLAGALLLLAAFVLIEHRQSDPAVPLRLFQSRPRSSSNILALFFASSSIGWAFAANLYLQEFLGQSPFRTALELLPYGLTVVLVAQTVTGRLISRIGLRAVGGLGMLVQTVGIGLFAFVGVSAHYPALLLPALILHGMGNGLVFPTMNIAGVSEVADREQGVASGLITASFQIGSGIGVAVISCVLTAATHGTGAHGRLDGYHAAFLTATAFALAGALTAFIGLRTPAEQPVNEPALVS